MAIGVHPKAAVSFVKAMSVVGKKHALREKAHKDLYEHIEEMKAASSKKKNISNHVDGLQFRIENVIAAEKQFAGYDLGSEEKVRELEERLSLLEQQFTAEREQSAMQIAHYKHTIDDMKKTFASLKTKLIELINERRERDRRMQQLHEKIQQGISTPSLQGQSLQSNLPSGFRY